MIFPSWASIEENYRDAGHEVWLLLSDSNPNPRLFKVYWRIFTRHSPWEGNEFLRHAPLTPTYEARLVVERYRDAGEPVWLYPLRRPRWDPDRMPWDLTSDRWRDVETWAPAFADDPDPVTADGFR
jgi:hypothetical protein